MKITIVLADDNEIVRQEIRALLELCPDLAVIGEAVNGRDAVRQVIQLCPDVAVLDLAMPLQDGIQAARRIRELNPNTQIVILLMHADHEYVIQALRVGVQGYVLKEDAGRELGNAIRTAHTGNAYLSVKLLANAGFDGLIVWQ